MTKSIELLRIIKELQENADMVNGQEIEMAAKLIAKSTMIFVAGCGRTGFAMRAFSNRLMHLGKQVHVVGDATTPAIRSGNLLIVGSGSGETGSLINITEKAKKIGAEVLLITIHGDSSIGKLADYRIILPGSTPKSQLKNTNKSMQAMGSSFEQMAWLVCDTLVMNLMHLLQMNEEKMFLNHANLE